MIERISQKRIGFYCWKISIINYFRFYEVICKIFLLVRFLTLLYPLLLQITAIIAGMFLKIVEISINLNINNYS